MAKPLVFKLDGSDIAFDLNKVDRAKLYGYKDIEVLDEHGMKCEMATLADDGHTIIGRGGTGIGYLSADGLWCEKSQLRPVDLSGQALEPVPSSFTAPIELGEPVSADEYLEHSIRGIYAMETETVDHALIAKLRDGAIYKFAYSYRGGLEADVAFLLCNDAGDVFMAVGSSTAIEYIGLQQVAATVEEEVSDDESESDDMDFSMI
ncbi:MAG: hypothetical protein IT423_15355 [Pirellulaceae bacterium]|nr:hypothetical protein [Pirellulaceae bacterium]